MSRAYRVLAWVLCVLALVVIVFGAYVRLTDAGLGCPDWPGCYGRLTVPQANPDLHQQHPDWAYRPLERGKAWREMIHRYLASSLGLGIIIMALMAWRQTRGRRLKLAPLLLVPLVVFQGLLGMWTVTLLLKPMVVTAHLLGGLATLALLWWNLLDTFLPDVSMPQAETVRRLVAIALTILVGQIFLGGWTSTNYAALACADFPQCQGQWWPKMDFQEAFVLWRGLGVNYEYGVLETPARTAIHMSHRLGAVLVSAVVLAAAIAALRTRWRPLVFAGTGILAMLTLQLGLGLSNVMWGLPLAVAVGHNAGAAGLLLTLLTAFFLTRRLPG